MTEENRSEDDPFELREECEIPEWDEGEAFSAACNFLHTKSPEVIRAILVAALVDINRAIYHLRSGMLTGDMVAELLSDYARIYNKNI